MKHPLIAVVMSVIVVGALAACTQREGQGSGPSGAPTSAVDAAEVAATIVVRPSTFSVTYRLDGSIQESSSAGVDVPPGTRFESSSDAKSKVHAGEELGVLRVDPSLAAEQVGTVVESRRRLAAARAGQVAAPISGVLTTDSRSVRIASPGLDVVVPVKPLQELRYRGLVFAGTATVETVLGQRRSACVAVWLEALPAGSGGAGDGARSAVRCRLAPDVETAAGIPAVLTLTTRPLSSVVAVPLVFIGLDRTGRNYVARVRQGSSYVERPVVVGATDGVRRVITEGLRVGDEISTPGTS